MKNTKILYAILFILLFFALYNTYILRELATSHNSLTTLINNHENKLSLLSDEIKVLDEFFTTTSDSIISNQNTLLTQNSRITELLDILSSDVAEEINETDYDSYITLSQEEYNLFTTREKHVLVKWNNLITADSSLSISDFTIGISLSHLLKNLDSTYTMDYFYLEGTAGNEGIVVLSDSYEFYFIGNRLAKIDMFDPNSLFESSVDANYLLSYLAQTYASNEYTITENEYSITVYDHSNTCNLIYYLHEDNLSYVSLAHEVISYE